MARINLLTMHYGESYGAILQTYATCKILSSLGHNVTIINLNNSDFKKRFFSRWSFLGYPKIYNFWIFKKRHYPHMTVMMRSIKDHFIPPCDYSIVGSDQVWNTDITQGNRLSYFLNFAKDCEKLSLSSSFGKGKWIECESFTTQVKQCLWQFKAVSVRETSGIAICRDVFQINAECLIDPTLAYNNYSNLIRKHPKKQIACFLLNPMNPILDSLLPEIIKIHDMRILFLDYYSGRKYRSLSTFHKSPKRWLNEMANSSVIITDSFHGVAFSIMFHKQFYVICADKAKFARIDSLLELLGLKSRIIENVDDYKSRCNVLEKEIDYNEVDRILMNERKRYFNFIQKNII